MSQLSPPALSAALPCHACGYDVRVQPPDGVCPECNTPVAESVRFAAIPRRPAWRDSDPRWRRRMLAGVWVLVLVPLMDTLRACGWAAKISVPTFIDVQGAQALDDSFIAQVYGYLMFCVGIVLLFSKERNRQPNRMDWTRRWGVITSYGVLLLGIPPFAFLAALVTIGIAAAFMSIRLPLQPAVTLLLVRLSTGYMYYGPHPSRLSDASLVVFSSIVVLLACVRLYEAMRCSGPRVLAAILLAPLVLASLVQLYYAGQHLLNLIPSSRIYFYWFYFNPVALATGVAELWIFPGSWSFDVNFLLEAAKWFAVLAIAVWLTIAQIAAKRRKPSSPPG